MPITVLQFDFYGLIFKKYNLVPRAHVSFDQHEDKELWNNRFLVQGFKRLFHSACVGTDQKTCGLCE